MQSSQIDDKIKLTKTYLKKYNTLYCLKILQVAVDYNIGSGKNLNNIQISKNILNVAKKYIKLQSKTKIIFVKDRPGHDVRYALNSSKIKKEIKWKPKTTFIEGIEKTFIWYLQNRKYYKYLNKKDILKRLGKNDQ